MEGAWGVPAQSTGTWEGQTPLGTAGSGSGRHGPQARRCCCCSLQGGAAHAAGVGGLALAAGEALLVQLLAALAPSLAGSSWLAPLSSERPGSALAVHSPPHLPALTARQMSAATAWPRCSTVSLQGTRGSPLSRPFLGHNVGLRSANSHLGPVRCRLLSEPFQNVSPPRHPPELARSPFPFTSPEPGARSHAESRLSCCPHRLPPWLWAGSC